MTNDEIRIAIAEACGWVLEPAGKDSFGVHIDTFWRHLTLQGIHKIPDYPNDLNAMHEAEEALPDHKRGFFNAELFLIAADRNLSCGIKEPEFIFQTIHATAHQRAEGFLRTIGKWID